VNYKQLCWVTGSKVLVWLGDSPFFAVHRIGEDEAFDTQYAIL